MSKRSVHFTHGKYLSKDARIVNHSIFKYLTGDDGVITNNITYSTDGSNLILNSGTINILGGSIELNGDIVSCTDNTTGYIAVVINLDATNSPKIETIQDSAGDHIQVHTGIEIDNVVDFIYVVGDPESNPNDNPNINFPDSGLHYEPLLTLTVSGGLISNVVPYVTVLPDALNLAERLGDTGWITLDYEPGYQPIVPNHYARYRIRDDILWVQGSVALVTGGPLPSTSFTAVSGIDLSGYFVTGIIQLDSLSINGGSNGASTYKTTVESDGRVVVAETPTSATTGANQSTYTSLDTIVLLDREV